MRIRGSIAGLALVFSLAACEGETPNLDQALEKAGNAAEKISSAVDDLDPSRVEELAKLAAQIEKSPEKANEMLKKHGLNRAQFDEALAKIQENSQWKQHFEKAKELASK